jgi:hypothetical protein
MNRMGQKSSSKNWIVRGICILMLLWALVPVNPYDYYVLLRWVCSPCFAYLAFVSYGNGRIPWAWIFGVSAWIYNPLFPIDPGREVWIVINIVTVVLLFAQDITLHKEKSSAD